MIAVAAAAVIAFAAAAALITGAAVAAMGLSASNGTQKQKKRDG